MPDHDLPRANWDDEMRSPAGQDRPWPGLSADEETRSLNSDLLSFRPPLDVQRDVVLHTGADAEFHRIEDGHGPVNLDFYPVHIERLPSLNGREMTPEDFVDYARRTLDDFLDDDVAKFSFYDKESLEKWASDDPLGAIMRFDIRPAWWNLNAGIDGGSVALTAQTPLSWTFSTVRTDEDHGHPVSGNREWGLAPQEDGTYVFYARGADRPTGVVDSLVFGDVFEGADDLWTGMQERVADWVNEHGGSATVMPRTWERHNWDSVSEDFFTPVTPWLDREDFLDTPESPPDECTADSAQRGIDPSDAVTEEFCPLDEPPPAADPSHGGDEETCPVEPQPEQAPDPALVEDVAPLECVVSPQEEELPPLEFLVPPVPPGTFDSPVELPDWLTPTPSGGPPAADPTAMQVSADPSLTFEPVDPPGLCTPADPLDARAATDASGLPGADPSRGFAPGSLVRSGGIAAGPDSPWAPGSGPPEASIVSGSSGFGGGPEVPGDPGGSGFGGGPETPADMGGSGFRGGPDAPGVPGSGFGSGPEAPMSPGSPGFGGGQGSPMDPGSSGFGGAPTDPGGFGSSSVAP